MYVGRIIIGSDLINDELRHDMLYGPVVLNSRYCPDMPGVQLQYIGSGEYMNPITGEIYDFSRGFKLNGKWYGGGSISEQTNADSDMIGVVPREPIIFIRR